jgi:hypothetical protein
MKPETKQELQINLDHADIGMILTLLSQESGSICEGLNRLERIEDPADKVDDAVFYALYQQQGRLKKLANKIKDQSPRDYDFDIEMQAVVLTESNE